MTIKHSSQRFGAWVLTIAALVAGHRSALAQESKQTDPTTECLSAHGDAQALRNSKSLKRARDVLLTCSRAACPALVRADCMQWLEEVNKAIPTVVVSARSGHDEVFDATVYVDGKLISNRLDGSEIELDPGVHTFKVQLPSWPDIERRILITSGEKARVLEFRFGAPPPAPGAVEQPPVAMHRPVPVPVYVLLGGAVLGAAGFAVFGSLGSADQRDLEDSGCDPFCTDEQMRSARTKYYIADASLIFGGLSAVGAGIVYLTRPSKPLPNQEVPSSDKSHARLKIVDVQAAPSGGVVRVGGQF